MSAPEYYLREEYQLLRQGPKSVDSAHLVIDVGYILYICYIESEEMYKDTPNDVC